MTGRECDAEIRRQLALGVKPDEVWRIFLGYVEALPVADINTQLAELDALAGLFDDEVRGVSRKAYCQIAEIDTGDREGPEWKFEGYLPEPEPVFRFARTAYHDFDDGIKPWLDFAERRQIRHWHFEGLRYRKVDELRAVFSEDYFRNSSGATLTWIDADAEACRELFAETALWRHWQTLRFEWLRSDEKSAFVRWFDMLAHSSIRRFSLQSCNPGAAGFQALADSPALTQLEELQLMNVVLGSPECDILLSGKYQPRRLKKLKLDDCCLSNGVPEIDGPTYVKLIGSPFFSALEDWENHYHTVGPDGIAALLRSPSRTTLRYISLHNSRLGDAGLKMIFDNAWPNLRGIYISYDTFSPELIRSLRQTRLYAQCEQVSIFPMDGEHIYKEKEILK
jgi:hypothetical protein